MAYEKLKDKGFDPVIGRDISPEVRLDTDLERAGKAVKTLVKMGAYLVEVKTVE